MRNRAFLGGKLQRKRPLRRTNGQHAVTFLNILFESYSPPEEMEIHKLAPQVIADTLSIPYILKDLVISVALRVSLEIQLRIF
jgi:hypothetical protein